MKKNIVLLPLLFAMVSTALAKNVTIQTAQRAAQSFLNSKMEGNPQIHLIDFAEKSSFPNFYVFGNERCFVIIAGDDCVHPVLGYSTENSFAADDMPENAYDWLKAYDEEIAYVAERRLNANIEIQVEWDKLLSGKGLFQKTRSGVHPLLKTYWNQRAPFNGLCPVDPNHSSGHVATGCVATAMAQVMNYWEHPVRGTGSHSYMLSNHPEYGELFADFGATIYDWDNMKNHYTTQGYTDAEALAVAILMFHCGVSIEIGYGDTNGSSGYMSDAATALKTYFDYTPNLVFRYKTQNNVVNYNDSLWIEMLKSELNLDRPILYRSSHDDPSIPIGHSFVCDGYDENDYFHFNWGWGGKDDGYYQIGDLNPNSQASPYNRNNAAIFNCYPNMPSINPPDEVDITLDGQEVMITWSAVPNAVSYRLYKDDEILANIPGTGYIDWNVTYGLHSYYVKSVDSDDIMSLKSNTVVAEVRFHGPVPTNLQSSTNGHNVTLTWQTQNSNTATLQYGSGSVIGGLGSSSGTYWAHRYPTSILMDYAGMAINRVSYYFRKAGAYTIFVCKGNMAAPTEIMYQQNYTTTSVGSWQDIVFPSPITIDYTQDLWIVFYSDAASYQASYCSYSGNDVADASLYSSNGQLWYCKTDRSWLMKTYLTDGTYTYNLYRNGNAVATNLDGNTYTDTNLPDGIYNYHVTTNYFGGESDPSNTASVLVGNPTYNINVSANPNNGGLVTGGGTYNYNQSCTVTATHNTGYTFVNWTENGEIVSTDSEYSFTVDNNRNLVANFIRITDIRFINAGNWSEASNWQEGALPCASDGVFIDAPCSLDMDTEVADLTVSGGAILTLQSDRILTVTGNLSSPEVVCLVIKDGAQIINTTENVNATMEKDIVAYEDERGWFTIASPMTGMYAEGSAFITPEYDLYRYNESNLTDEEWENYKSGVEDFSTFENGRGYLYANSNTFTPAFTGTLNVASVSKELTYTERSDELSGFHLIGNPFPHVIYKGLGAAIDNADMASGYYVLNDSGSWEAKTFEDAILPGQGILVKTTASTDLIINNSTAMANSESTTRKGSHKRLAITVTCNEGKDCVYAYFGQGNDLAKVKGMAQNNPRFAIRTTNGDFAIAHFAKESDEMDLVFASFNNGPVTLGVNAAAVDFEYLHLVDLSTGDDIDLLRQPSYTFDALGQNHKTCFKIFYRLSSVEMNQ